MASPWENLSFSQQKRIQNRFNLNLRWGYRWLWVKGSKAVEEGGKWSGMWKERGLVLEDRWEAEIDQRVGERLSLPTCQGTGSSSWSQVTVRVETLHARPPCLSGSSPWCPSCPSTAKILVVLSIQHVPVMLIGFVRWRIEKGGVSLRYAKKELISTSQAVWQACFHPPRFDFVDNLTVQNGLCIGRMAKMTLIVPVCCVHVPVVPRAVISTHRVHYMERHVLEHIYRAHMPILKHRGESGYILICMNLISFDKLGLLALVKPVGLAVEPLSCNTQEAAWFLLSTGCFITTSPLESLIISTMPQLGYDWHSCMNPLPADGKSY